MSWLLATFRKLILSGLSLFIILKDLHFCEDWVILSLSGKHLSMMKMMVMVMMMMVMAMMVMMVVMVQMECGNLTPAPICPGTSHGQSTRTRGAEADETLRHWTSLR